MSDASDTWELIEQLRRDVAARGVRLKAAREGTPLVLATEVASFNQAVSAIAAALVAVQTEVDVLSRERVE